MSVPVSICIFSEQYDKEDITKNILFPDVSLLFKQHLFSFFKKQVEELKETVKEEFMPWVSQYLVMKRVSIEPNFHSLYSNFLDTLKNPEFVKMVLNETYRNIKVHLHFKTMLFSPCKRFDLTLQALPY